MPDRNNGNKQRRGRWVGGGDPGSGGPGAPRVRVNPLIAIGVALVMLLLFNAWLRGTSSSQIDFSKFQSYVALGRIVDTVDIGSSTVSGIYKTDTNDQIRFMSTIPPNYQSNVLTQYLSDHNVEYRGVGQGLLGPLLINTLPFVLLMVLIYYFLFRRMG